MNIVNQEVELSSIFCRNGLLIGGSNNAIYYLNKNKDSTRIVDFNDSIYMKELLKYYETETIINYCDNYIVVQGLLQHNTIRKSVIAVFDYEGNLIREEKNNKLNL